MDLSAGDGMFEVKWYDPRNGGALQTGTVQVIPGGAVCSLGGPPKDGDQDWAILVRRVDANRN